MENEQIDNSFTPEEALAMAKAKKESELPTQTAPVESEPVIIDVEPLVESEAQVVPEEIIEQSNA